MFIIKPYIFRQFDDLIFGFSTKIGLNREWPYFYNISLSVGDDEEIVKENRKKLFSYLNLEDFKIHFQKQTHSDIIRVVDSSSSVEESDAMICLEPRNALAIVVADCVSIFIFDIKRKIIAGIHSGWRGTYKRILEKTLIKLFNDFGSKADDLYCYLGPSISQVNYEVGEEVACLFDEKYLLKTNNKIFLDVAAVNYDILINYNIPDIQIQKSSLCTYEMKELFHSFRRDGQKSGRLVGLIGLK
ncbi:MAG: peptidoglycan editing factor PgeF [Ignavibacterium sp.]|nr:peptidoglycan editing factor PgeF [Ignavibacterium sp.]